MKGVQPFVRVCASCKRVHDADGLWKVPKRFAASLPANRITHGICPRCISRLYPDIYLTLAKEVHDEL